MYSEIYVHSKKRNPRKILKKEDIKRKSQKMTNQKHKNRRGAEEGPPTSANKQKI